ncbi:MAG: hypothetical protein R3C05_14530 [Pirellulaceae bacterium]
MTNQSFALCLALVVLGSTLQAQDQPEKPSIEKKEGNPTPADGIEALKAEDVKADDDAEAIDFAAAAAEEDQWNIVIELIDDDRVLNGELLDTENLVVQTAFGPASIPLLKVLGIRMARSATDTTTIVLHNGDMITGQVDIRSLLIRTKWGKSEVNGANLASIYFDEGLTWESLDLLAGPRWTLVNAKTDTSSTRNPSKGTALASQ